LAKCHICAHLQISNIIVQARRPMEWRHHDDDFVREESPRSCRNLGRATQRCLGSLSEKREGKSRFPWQGSSIVSPWRLSANWRPWRNTLHTRHAGGHARHFLTATDSSCLRIRLERCVRLQREIVRFKTFHYRQ
jgi:hypothetical protein